MIRVSLGTIAAAALVVWWLFGRHVAATVAIGGGDVVVGPWRATADADARAAMDVGP